MIRARVEIVWGLVPRPLAQTNDGARLRAQQPTSNLALHDVQITSSPCSTAACLREGPSGVG